MKKRTFIGRLAGGLAAAANAGLVALHLKRRPGVDLMEIFSLVHKIKRARALRGRDGKIRYYLTKEYVDAYEKLGLECPDKVKEFGDVEA